LDDLAKDLAGHLRKSLKRRHYDLECWLKRLNELLTQLADKGQNRVQCGLDCLHELLPHLAASLSLGKERDECRGGEGQRSNHCHERVCLKYT